VRSLTLQLGAAAAIAASLVQENDAYYVMMLYLIQKQLARKLMLIK
jgi:hypothetical protein